MSIKDLFWSIVPTFDVGWGCGHTDTFTINVLRQIRKRYTIERYYRKTRTLIVSEICPYCEERVKNRREAATNENNS